MKRLNKQHGLSLVEVLVALVISLFLLGGIVQVYTGNKQTFAFTNALAEIQESGRFALDTMSQDLRMAGEWGCIAFDPDDTSNINDTLGAGNVANYDTDFHDFLDEDGIEGTNNTGPNGSDTLIIRGAKPGQANVQGPFATETEQWLHTDTINTIGAQDIILVARCGDYQIDVEADILSVDSVVVGTTSDQRRINLNADKSQQFENDAMVIELQTVTYDIDNGASGEPALFRQEFNQPAQELIEGIEDMQILYGIDGADNDGFPNRYVSADDVPDFEDVVSVRLMLLVRSVNDFITDTPQTYTFNGAQTTAADRRLRQVFSATIALRNRVGSS